MTYLNPYQEWLKENPMPTPDYSPSGVPAIPIAFGGGGTLGAWHQYAGGQKYTDVGWKALNDWEKAASAAGRGVNWDYISPMPSTAEDMRRLDYQLKSGLVTQEQYDQYKSPSSRIPSTTNSTASGGNVAAAANNLANASKPKVPQFITPYQSSARGFGAFGERDIF